MKRIFLSLALMLGTLTANSMPYREARENALFLTDKMAYELNLTERQYDDAYQINLDYFLSIATPDDLYGPYSRCRDRDLRYILMDWQYAIFASADYFFQPLLWRANSWFLPILHRYDRAHFYFSHPRVCDVYRGGGHINYVTRRPPKWHGGMMGHEPRGGARPDYNYRHPDRGNNQPYPSTRPNNNYQPHGGRGGNHPQQGGNSHTTRPQQSQQQPQRGGDMRTSRPQQPQRGGDMRTTRPQQPQHGGQTQRPTQNGRNGQRHSGNRAL